MLYLKYLNNIHSQLYCINIDHLSYTTILIPNDKFFKEYITRLFNLTTKYNIMII